MIVLLVMLLRIVLSPRLIEAARTQAERGIAGRMEGHAAMDMSLAGGSLLSRALSLEAQGHDAGDRRIQEPQPDPLAGSHTHRVGHLAVDRDGVADPTIHRFFHRVVEAGRDLSVVHQPPVLYGPVQLAIDRGRVGFLNDQRTRQAAPDLHEAVVVRMVPKRAGIRRGEGIVEAFAGRNRLLGKAWHAVHRVRQPDAVPMHRGGLGQPVLDRGPERRALAVSGGQNARLSGREMPSGSLSPVLATSEQRGFNRAAHAELKVAFPLSTSAFLPTCRSGSALDDTAVTVCRLVNSPMLETLSKAIAEERTRHGSRI
jgi:hypothetical protein